MTHDARDDYVDAWSSDGSRLLFHSPLDGNADLYVIDPDGRNQRRVIDGGP